MSQAALDARRISIKKARAVPKEVLYRSTPKRLESCRTKLVVAREAKRRKREEGRTTGITHGLSCADLRASLAASGSTPDDLKAHRQMFRDQLNPQTPTETKLARGMADCAFRRLQVGHVQAVEEVITMQSRLIVAAEPGQANLTDFEVAKLALHMFNRGLDLDERLNKLNSRFAHLAYLYLEGRGEHQDFPVKLGWNASNREMLEWSAEAQGNPFATVRQVERVTAAKSGEMKPADQFEWKGKEKRVEERREKIRQEALYSDAPELADYPYHHQAESVAALVDRGLNVVVVMDGGRTEVQLRPKAEDFPADRARVEDESRESGHGPGSVSEPRTPNPEPPSSSAIPDSQPPTPAPSSPAPASPPRTVLYMGGTAQLAAGIGPSEWPEWREAEVAAALRKKYLETSVALRGKNQIGGVTKNDLVQSFLEAFARDGVRDLGFGVRREEGDGGPSSSANPETQTPNPDPADVERIKAAAEAAWKRVKVCENRSRIERAKLAEILSWAGSSIKEKLHRAIRLFADVKEMFNSMCEWTTKLRQRVCALLEARHPRTRENPGRPNDYEGIWPSGVWSDTKTRKRFLKDMAVLGSDE